jgi:hypothetical protein
MVGGIDADNAGSIRLHERFGFTTSSQLYQAGHKFGLDAAHVGATIAAHSKSKSASGSPGATGLRWWFWG